MPSVFRLGIVGSNTIHAFEFARAFNGEAGQNPDVSGAQVVAIWGDDPDSAADVAQRSGIRDVAASAPGLVGKVDGVLVVDDTGGGASHAGLAIPFLEAGTPTFIDKPMSLTVKEATALFDLAEKHGATLLSASALRFAPELSILDGVDLGPVIGAVVVGPGEWFYYGIHAVEFMQVVLGGGSAGVHRHSFADCDIVVIDYPGRPNVVVETIRNSAWDGHELNLFGAGATARISVSDYRRSYVALMQAVLDSFRSRVPAVSRADTVEVLSILEAGQMSADANRRVALEEVRR